jgi:hypothetical protein
MMARKTGGCDLLWWPCCYLLHLWGRHKVVLLLLMLRLELLLLGLAQLTLEWGIHHTILWRNTARPIPTRGSMRHPLPLFLVGLNNGLHHPLLVDGCTCQLIVRQARELYQAFLQMDGEPCTVHVGLLFICVHVVCAILSQGVELPGVVIHCMVPLLKVLKLLQLAAKQTRK